MRKTFRTLWIALSIALVSACSETNEEQSAAKTIRVTVGSGAKIDLDSRTALEEDGFSIRWATNDKIALWALDSSGNATLAAHPFSMYHYNATYGNAKFTADIPEMPAGEYTYCAVSPAPAAANVNGTQASFDIPATQNGTFDGRYDIMVAAAGQTAGALEEGDNSERVNLQFVHKVHLLKIAIPANKMGTPITSLKLTFPTAVTGRLTVDAANPEADPVLSGGSNVLTLNFDEPKDAGDIVYALIAPTTIADTENISIKAYASGLTSVPVNMFKEGFTGRKFAAGHATPINLTVPELYKFTQLIFSIGTNNLGEAPQTITVKAPSGTTFPNGSQSLTLSPDSNNKFVFGYEGDFTNNLSGKTFTITYDSEHATVSNTYVMPSITAYNTNTLTSLTVPYLFEQNFNAATSGSSSVYDVSATSTDETTTTESLSGYNLANWSAARWSITSDKLLSTRCFARQTWVSKRINVRGRIDSAPITGLKKSCKIKVTFDYKTSVTRNSSVGTFDGSATGAIGYNSGAPQNSAKYTNGSDNTSTWNVSSPNTLSHSTSLKSISCTFSSFQNNYRLAWEVTGSGTITNANGYYQLDIDNIKVSIAQ